MRYSFVNRVYKKDIHRFGERAFSSIEKNYSCGYKIAYLIAKFTKNDSYYRYRFYKAFRKYEISKNLIAKLFHYRTYSRFCHILNVYLICEHIGIGFYFEHGNIVINKEAYLGDNIYLVGNNCIGGKAGAPFLGNDVKIGWGGVCYWGC